MMSRAAFSIVLYVVLMLLAVLNVASIKTPKFTGKWYFVLIAYTVLMSMLFSWQWYSL
jgi:CDP-diacylglycerol--serine O-phosphatidyltransferase